MLAAQILGPKSRASAEESGLLLWRWPRIQTNYASLRSSSNIIRNSNSNQTQKVSEKLQTRDPISVSMNSHALYDTAAYLPYLTFSFSRLDVGISWKIKTTMTYLVCILLWNHIRFSFIAKNFGQCDLSIYRLVRGFLFFPKFHMFFVLEAVIASVLAINFRPSVW